MRTEDQIRVQHMIDAAESAAQFLDGRQRRDLDSDRKRMNTSKAMSFTKPIGILYTLLSPRRKTLYSVTLLDFLHSVAGTQTDLVWLPSYLAKCGFCAFHGQFTS